MFKVFLKHFIYELCITQVMDNIGMNLFNKLPIPDKHFDYDKAKDKWMPVIISKIGGPIPEYAIKIFVESIEEQLIFNKLNGVMCYNEYQKYTLPIIRRMFGSENIGSFKIGKRYEPQFKGTVYISEEAIQDLQFAMGQDAEAQILEYLAFEMNTLIAGEDINGILMRFTETSLSVYI